jgi:hypothetical protein
VLVSYTALLVGLVVAIPAIKPGMARRRRTGGGWNGGFSGGAVKIQCGFPPVPAVVN